MLLTVLAQPLNSALFSRVRVKDGDVLICSLEAPPFCGQQSYLFPSFCSKTYCR